MKQAGCCSGNCGCGAATSRRDFFKVAGAGVLALASPPVPVMAGPFEAADFDKLVPADKKLDAAWVKSLVERGAPAMYRGADLRYIGMPVGGLCAGQLYLGGDGKLWCWDIFNQAVATGDGHYAKPPEAASPLEQSFSLKIGAQAIPLDKSGFPDVSFLGQYPVGTVTYKDAGVPVEVMLEAFSPFIPLNAADSGLPATVMRFTVRNTSAATVAAALVGTLENAVCLHHRQATATRRNRVVAGGGFTFLECSAERAEAAAAQPQPDIVFEDWHQAAYDGWTAEGTAFGAGPVKKSAAPAYQGDVGGDTESLVNSHAAAPGKDVGEKDNATGRLRSRAFAVERDYIRFWIGGGSHKDKTCLNLVVDGKVVRSVTGRDNNRMALQSFAVREFKGRQATFEIVDAQAGAWGNVGVGRIVFSDRELVEGPFEELPDYGTMGLALLGPNADVTSGEKSAPLSEKLVGELGRNLRLEAGQSATVTFLVTWFFPNLRHLPEIPIQGRHYASRFDSALAVARYVAANQERLVAQTLLWRDTWYDSTLPFWFLDRTFLNTSILASSTCYRFEDGRFWAWEGVGCCAGTCAHVWHYAQAMGRQFPELERILRERVDFGLALQPGGAIRFRGENNGGPAVDAQAGAILRSLREHQMSADDAFLRRVWPGVKRAVLWLIAQDGDGDGILEGGQHNTLDTDWYGPVAWLSGLYLAALQAAAALADEMNDRALAQRCRGILERGQKRIVADLFDGEYFYNKVDPRHPETVNSGTGCEIDQVMGQSWAFQVGLPRVLPEKETRAALKALWRYNFSPDVGPYREINKPGRWYAMAGEAGLLMCTFPRKGWDYEKAKGGAGKGAWAAMYFNECMNGFEHQVAGHMIWEGLVQEGLAVERAVHDRYHASKRNPWNEVECGDHYARSMASYGVFLAACGFEYDGPKGHIGFAPRLTPENFKAAFTAAEGWGTYSQRAEVGGQRSEVAVKWGRLRVKALAFVMTKKPTSVAVRVGDKVIGASVSYQDGRATVTLAEDVVLAVGQVIEVALS
jgi:uncharacterized protein (DUF608 family)